MLRIFVDADACPVKDEVIRVAERHALMVYMVSDGGIKPYFSEMIKIVVVARGPDAADNWIVEQIDAGDIVITNDIPLADRCLKNGASALQPNGRTFTDDSIGMAVAVRNLMSGLRAKGEVTGGPPPFSRKDRSSFLQALETAIQKQLNL